MLGGVGVGGVNLDLTRPWRVGRKVGRTIYSCAGTGDPDDDRLIGMLDTHALAAEAVAGHNERWARAGRQA